MNPFYYVFIFFAIISCTPLEKETAIIENKVEKKPTKDFYNHLACECNGKIDYGIECGSQILICSIDTIIYDKPTNNHVHYALQLRDSLVGYSLCTDVVITSNHGVVDTLFAKDITSKVKIRKINDLNVIIADIEGDFISQKTKRINRLSFKDSIPIGIYCP